MKKLHITSLLASAILMLSACDKDDKSPNPLEDATYSELDKIEVSYNGTLMAGKQCTFTQNYGNGATLLFESLFDISQLGETFKNMPAIQAPGVLPGSPKLAVSISPTVKNGKYTFSQQGETDFVTYTLSGTITDKLLKADFSDVKLKNQTFANTVWTPMKAAGLPTADSQPIHIVWETSLPIPIPGLEYTIQDMLRILVNAHLIPVYNNTANMSLTQVIANGLRTIAFNSDGNLLVTYLQTSNGASVYTLAPKCTFQYVPVNSQMINLYANPTDLLSLILLNNDKKDPNIPENPWKKETRTDATFSQLLGNLAQMVLPMVATGFPTNCIIDGKTLQIYLGSEVLLPLLKQGIVPLLQNPESKGIVENYIKSNDELAPYSEQLMLLYEALPTILNQTSRLEIGLNLTAA